jgi:uncharacterized protein YhhL (DUF1145 family)
VTGGLKLAVAASWLIGLAGLLGVVEGSAGQYCRWLFWLLAGVHAVECGVFLPKLRAAGGSLANHLLQTFLFGVLHVRSLPAGR